MREKAAIETQLEQQQQQAMVEAARQAMLEQARMEAQEAARRDADELRRSVIEDARKQVEEETRRHREAMQLQMQREAEVLARQQAEALEHARRQALELDMRRAALEKAQQRQQEAEEAARRQAEALARQQAAFEEQKRAMSMLPPANTPGAGSALLSLLQGGGGRPAPNGMAQLPGWNGGQHPHGGMSASSQLEQLWSQASPPAATELSPSAEQALGRVGRGRGRGVCSAALGTGRQLSRENVLDSASALAGLSLGHADALGLPSPGMPPAFDYADADARLEGEDDDDARRGRKGRKGRAARGKDVETFGDDAELPQGGDGMPGRLAAWQQPAPASPPQPKAAAPPQPSKGWAAQALAASPARAPAADRPQSLHAIQEQEERERLRREAAAAQALQAQRAAGVTQPHGVWGSVNKPPAAAPPPPAPPPPRLPEVLPEDAGLWDYGAAGTGAPAGNNGAAPGKAKKKKGKGADESSNGGALEGEADFDLGGENMPSAMAKWCVEQMRGLTGSDDVTLAHFLFSLQDDTEVESYLSMYLGKSDAVSAFAKEFTLRKKAARGLGESRDWQTCAARTRAKPSLLPRAGSLGRHPSPSRVLRRAPPSHHDGRTPPPSPSAQAETAWQNRASGRARRRRRGGRLRGRQGETQGQEEVCGPVLARLLGRIQPHHAGGDRLPRVMRAPSCRALSSHVPIHAPVSTTTLQSPPHAGVHAASRCQLRLRSGTDVSAPTPPDLGVGGFAEEGAG